MKSTTQIVPRQLRKYAGRRFHIEDQFTRAIHMSFTLTSECLAGPEAPFSQIGVNGLLLNDQTRDYLYDPKVGFGTTRRKYRQGTYPLLERYIDSLVTPGMSDGEKVIALAQSMHYDLPKRYPKVPVFLYGEDDQDTLLKGGGHCSCRSRLLVALCQILGIQARPAMQWAWIDREKNTEKLLGGHSVNEVLIDGNWGYFDPQHHLYCYDGTRFYGIAEIRENPDLFTKMPDSVTGPMAAVGYRPEDQGAMSLWEYYWYKNFNPKCPIQISRYDTTEPYRGRWLWATRDFRDKQTADFERNKAILIALADRGELTDEIYQMGLDEFREHVGITDGALPSQFPRRQQPALAAV